MRSGRSSPSSRRERANLRARRRLEEARSSPCGHCGRVTKTVDGMCADCWGVKDPERAKRWLRARPRTRSFFEDPLIDFDDPEHLLWLLGAIVAIALIVIVLASQWI
jgi:hypothetical protein